MRGQENREGQKKKCAVAQSSLFDLEPAFLGAPILLVSQLLRLCYVDNDTPSNFAFLKFLQSPSDV